MTNYILTETFIFGGKIKFYYRTDDKFIGQRVALGKYEIYETELILRQINKDDVVLDIGANIGYYAILMATKAKKVYAFEPDLTNFSILEKNIRANNLKNIVAVCAAVSDKNGESFLYKSEENFGDHSLKTPQNQNPLVNITTSSLDREAIKTIKLDDFIREKVDLIKIDTQGWEPKVIEGAKNIIAKYYPTIFFEYWPEGYRRSGLNSTQMMKFLQSIYGNFFVIDDWLNIYRSLKKEKIDYICNKNKTGYCDLLVKKEINLSDKLGQVRDFKVKKWVKKLLSIIKFNYVGN